MESAHDRSHRGNAPRREEARPHQDVLLSPAAGVRPERIFGPMADLADAAEERPRFVLMVGDQIYADMFNRRLPFGRADTYQEFRERLPDRLRVTQHPPAHAALAHLHDPRRSRNRGQLVPGPAAPLGPLPAAILLKIVEAGIQNVVFLSGDIHCCNVAEIFATGTPEAERIRVLSVTSSAFYWPFPFADGEPSDFVHDSRATGQEDTFRFEDTEGRELKMDYRARNFSQEDNFTHLTVDPATHTLRVRVYNNAGSDRG